MTFPTGLIVLPLFDESIYISAICVSIIHIHHLHVDLNILNIFQRYIRNMADSAIIRPGELRLSCSPVLSIDRNLGIFLGNR